MAHSIDWHLEQAKKARELRQRQPDQMKRVLALSIENILNGSTKNHLILDAEAVRQNRKFYEKKIKELRREL